LFNHEEAPQAIRLASLEKAYDVARTFGEALAVSRLCEENSPQSLRALRKAIELSTRADELQELLFMYVPGTWEYHEIPRLACIKLGKMFMEG
jgi:hypothetical protein